MDQPPEPSFTAIAASDREYQAAYDAAARSMQESQSYVLGDGTQTCFAKLAFKDPDEGDDTEPGTLIYLWLRVLVYDTTDAVYLGEFFEVPSELGQWHHVGQRLWFDTEDVFDWLVNVEGTAYGGFTLRVLRSRLPEVEQRELDEELGVKCWSEVQ